MKNAEKALEAIEILVGGDFGNDLELFTHKMKDIANPKNTLRQAGLIFSQIYRIAHAETKHNCSHESWEEEKFAILGADNPKSVYH